MEFSKSEIHFNNAPNIIYAIIYYFLFIVVFIFIKLICMLFEIIIYLCRDICTEY